MPFLPIKQPIRNICDEILKITSGNKLLRLIKSHLQLLIVSGETFSSSGLVRLFCCLKHILQQFTLFSQQVPVYNYLCSNRQLVHNVAMNETKSIRVNCEDVFNNFPVNFSLHIFYLQCLHSAKIILFLEVARLKNVD